MVNIFLLVLHYTYAWCYLHNAINWNYTLVSLLSYIAIPSSLQATFMNKFIRNFCDYYLPCERNEWSSEGVNKWKAHAHIRLPITDDNIEDFKGFDSNIYHLYGALHTYIYIYVQWMNLIIVLEYAKN